MNEVTQEPSITRYRCPFHGEVKADEPKKCYKCGMKLEPFKPTQTPFKP